MKYKELIKKISIYAIILLTLGDLKSLGADSNEQNIGNIKTIFITGDGWAITSDQKPKKIENGTFLEEGTVIKSSLKGQIHLLFDNGSITEIGNNSEINIKKYKVKEFDSSKINYTSLKTEPTQSITEIEVLKGTLIVKAPKLSKESGFNITTPTAVGTIIGTTVGVHVSNESSTFIIQEGEVVIQKSTGTYFIGEGENTDIENSKTGNSEAPVIVSSDPNYQPPLELLDTLSAQITDFSSLVNSNLSDYTMAGAPPQKKEGETSTGADKPNGNESSDTNSDDNGSSDSNQYSSGNDSSTGGSPLPIAPFAGGGGGGGGGQIYSR
jgi:hypothetical protein